MELVLRYSGGVWYPSFTGDNLPAVTTGDKVRSPPLMNGTLGESVTTDGRGETARALANGCAGGIRGEEPMSLLISLAASAFRFLSSKR